MPARFPVALVGVGKIARDQHIPAIAATRTSARRRRFPQRDDRRRAELPRPRRLPRRGAAGGGGALRPAQARTAMALKALAAGRDVLLEKPPAATLGEVDRMVAAARDSGRRALRDLALPLRARPWPRRKAWLAGAPPARSRSSGRRTCAAGIPNQAWIRQPGGLRRLRPRDQRPLAPHRDPAGAVPRRPRTSRRPGELRDPDRGRFAMTAAQGFPVASSSTGARKARRPGTSPWRPTGAGSTSRAAARRWPSTDARRPRHRTGSTRCIYRRFADLLAARESEVDASPLRIIADAFLIGRRETTEPFFD